MPFEDQNLTLKDEAFQGDDKKTVGCGESLIDWTE